MNKRIKELALQAGASRVYDPDHPTDDPLLRLKHIGIEKFAKLIVQECIKMMDTNISGVFNSDWDFETQAKFVKTQFGAE